ncbi:MAG: hypothetical protein ACLS6Y_05500 [Streptococcus salivarius]
MLFLTICVYGGSYFYNIFVHYFSITSIHCKFFKERGKTNIYYQTVYDRFTSEPWGFHGSNTDEYFDVPLWIEIHNSKGTRQIIRNLNLSLYLAGKFISKTKQINYHEKTPYGDNGSYSFLIEAGEIKRFNLYFVLKGGDIDFMDFDEVIVLF